MPIVTRDALAEYEVERAQEAAEAAWVAWHNVNGRCGRQVADPAECACFTVADMYVVAPDGSCHPEPDAAYECAYSF